MISVVCVYNNKDILNNWLLKSLKNQTVEFELITLDNTVNAFKSAAEALNYGGNKAKGKYIMFVHQDVDLSSNTWLEGVEKMLDSISNLGIAGVAGSCENRKGVITNIQDGIPPKLAGSIQINKPTKVQTLDECLVIVPKPVFDKLRFDEKVCDDWHLYAVDYCLDVKKLGFDVYVIPMFIYHRGSTSSLSGQFPKGYYLTLKKLLNKHKNNVRQIYAPTGIWSTSQPLIYQKMQRILLRRGAIMLEKLGIKKEVKAILQKLGIPKQ